MKKLARSQSCADLSLAPSTAKLVIKRADLNVSGRGEYDLSAYELMQFVPIDSRAKMPELIAPATKCAPAAMMGLIQKLTLEPTRKAARQVLGTTGTELTALAAQMGMMALILMAVTHFTGLGALVSLAIAIGAIVGAALPGMLIHQRVARLRLQAQTPEAAALRAMRDRLFLLERYLVGANLDGELHTALLQETRDALAQIDATWGYLFKQAVTRAKMPVVFVAEVACKLLVRSALGCRLIRALRERKYLPMHPPTRTTAL